MMDISAHRRRRRRATLRENPVIDPASSTRPSTSSGGAPPPLRPGLRRRRALLARPTSSRSSTPRTRRTIPRRRPRLPRRPRHPAAQRAAATSTSSSTGSTAARRASSAPSPAATGRWTATSAGTACTRPTRPSSAATRRRPTTAYEAIAASLQRGVRRRIRRAHPHRRLQRMQGDSWPTSPPSARPGMVRRGDGLRLQLPARPHARALRDAHPARTCRPRSRRCSPSGKADPRLRPALVRHHDRVRRDPRRSPSPSPRRSSPSRSASSSRRAGLQPAPLRRDREVRPRDLLLQRRARAALRGRGPRARAVAARRRDLRPEARDERGRRRRRGRRTASRAASYDFILVNFANPDMVGHTGKLDAAINAVEAVDACVGAISTRCSAAGRRAHRHRRSRQLRADERRQDGSPHTAHTTNPVPLYYVNDADKGATLRAGGRICDVAPTMLNPRPPPARGDDRPLAPRPLSPLAGTPPPPGPHPPAHPRPLRRPRDGRGARLHGDLPRRAARARAHGADQDAQADRLRRLALRRRARARGRGPGPPRSRGRGPPPRARRTRRRRLYLVLEDARAVPARRVLARRATIGATSTPRSLPPWRSAPPARSATRTSAAWSTARSGAARRGHRAARAGGRHRLLRRRGRRRRPAGGARALRGRRGAWPSPSYHGARAESSASPLGPRADVWALGVLLHELLRRRPPLRGRRSPGARPAHPQHGAPRRCRPRRPRRSSRASSPAASPRRPDDRFPDARAVAAALEEALAELTRLPVPVLVSRALAAARPRRGAPRARRAPRWSPAPGPRAPTCPARRARSRWCWRSSSQAAPGLRMLDDPDAARQRRRGRERPGGRRQPRPRPRARGGPPGPRSTSTASWWT